MSVKRLLGRALVDAAMAGLAAAPEAGRAQAIYSSANPIIYINDQPNDVYTDGIVFALASNGEINLAGLISSGVDCKCGSGDNYPNTNTPKQRQEWIDAARASGFVNLPNNVNGTQGPKLIKPASGRIEDTVPIDSAGSRLIVQEALAAPAGRPLAVLVGSPITTLADAYLLDNRIAGKVVVGVLAGVDAQNAVSSWNAADSWAMAIVMAKFPVILFEVFEDAAHTPNSRIRAELPNKPFREKLATAGYAQPNYDGDGQPWILVRWPEYLLSTRRISCDRHQGDRCYVKDDPNGDDYYLVDGNDNVATDEWWRAVKKAFAGGSATGGSSSGGSTAGSGGGGGLAASYYNNRTFSGAPALTRTDGPIDFDWGGSSPGTGVNADQFAVRWTGKVEAPVSGSYKFQTPSDDGITRRLAALWRGCDGSFQEVRVRCPSRGIGC